MRQLHTRIDPGKSADYTAVRLGLGLGVGLGLVLGLGLGSVVCTWISSFVYSRCLSTLSYSSSGLCTT